MTLSLAAIFSDNLVLQRDMPVPVWGWADPCVAIIVTFGHQLKQTVAADDGRWQIKLDPLPECTEPQDLVVTGPQGASLTCKNVLVGEVWLCSGQSNMEWPMAFTANAEAEIAEANFPLIRLFTVPKRLELEPTQSIAGTGWTACSPSSVEPFSAVGYFFGRELHRVLGVPIGLIHSSFGGTPAEAWISKEGLLQDKTIANLWTDFHPITPKMLELSTQWKTHISAIQQRTTDSQNKGDAQGYAAIAEPPGDWHEMQIPGTWQKRGLDFNGIFWFRKSVQIPSSWQGEDLQLSIGATDKSDITYFNGQQIGSVTMQQRQDSWSHLRTYPVPAAAVRSGTNMIAVRVHSDRYDGGMTGPESKMYLSCPTDLTHPPIPLAGVWRYTVEENYGQIVWPPAPPGPENPSSPTILYNGMIAPLVPYALRGAIWYQGESNADRAAQYRSLFPALIQDWRTKWEQNLAFHFVQLANYRPLKLDPSESEWADLREAQTLALKLPNTGMAVAIDIGEADDIHPRNKHDVGRRLAFSVLHRTYRYDIPFSGPTLKSAQPEGGAIRIHFNHAEKGLVLSGDTLQGFAVAGDDRKFIWCDATIDGDSVLLHPPAGKTVRHIRYAWADNPFCNLYNTAHLPAAPFQTDLG